MATINDERLDALIEAEGSAYRSRHARSAATYAGADHLFGRVPMTWMNKWPGGFPLSFSTAEGASITCVDGHRFGDFALGDTGAMAGHSPAAVVEAIRVRTAEQGGITTMLTTDDAEWVGAELARRIGLEQWSFTLSATDANRFALRIARLVTGRPKVLCCSYGYHGSVDETFVVLDAQGTKRSRPGNVAPAVDPTTTTEVVEFNDLVGLERALAGRDVAVVIMEPAMTNIGIVLPASGYLEAVRRLCDLTGTLLLIDETHTFSLGEGGATKRWGLEPDLVTIGKSIGGGVPCGAYGLRAELAEAVFAAAARGADLVDVGGVGGTLAGNALSLAAMRATLGEVLTAPAFEAMEALADRFTAQVQGHLERTGAPFSITQLGARAEYRFCTPAPTSGGEAAQGDHPRLTEAVHLYLCNRGLLLTPFHNMALMCPATTVEQVDLHGEVFGAFLDEVLS